MNGTQIDQNVLTWFKYYQDLSKDKKSKSPLQGQPLLLLIDPTMQGNQLSIKVSNLTLLILKFLGLEYYHI